MALKLLFVADPVDTYNIDRDTTFAIMLEAQRRGHSCYEAHLVGLSALNGVPHARCCGVTVQRLPAPQNVARAPWTNVGMHKFDAVFMRKDPPVDEAYTSALWLMDLTSRKKTQLINEPKAILAANEKVYALRFPEFTPETLVTRAAADVIAFFKDAEDIILKPLDGHGGSGVLRVQKGDRNFRSMVDLLTSEGKRWIMVQRYVKEARQGDKRIVLIDGKPVGAIMRVPPEDDNRGNIHVGARVEKATLTPREREMCEALGPELRKDGLLLVGIDVIGDKLTEVNVTSPTGVQEIGRFDGTSPESLLLDVVESRAA